MKQIAIIGAGGHTRSSINLLKQYFPLQSLQIFDDSYNDNMTEIIHNIHLVGRVEEISESHQVFLSIGNNSEREQLFQQYNHQIIKTNLFHGKSFQESDLSIGQSNQIFANTYLNSYVHLGDNNIINTSAILEHEVEIGNHNHISVGATLCGRVKIGNGCFIGAGAVIIDKVSIGNDVIIGAGSVVVQDIKECGTYVGNPARKIK